MAQHSPYPRLTASLAAAALGLSLLLAASTAAADDPAAGVAPGKTFKDCPDCADMVVIPAGKFTMGSSPEERRREGVPPLFGDRESPQVEVTIAKPFAMARTETTRAQFAAFVAATHRPKPADCVVYDKSKDSWGGGQGLGYSYANAPFPQTDDHPAVCISWNDANDFAAWMTQKTGHHYFLPSEAQWEYAARGGTSTARYWGDDVRPVCEKANIMTSATFAAIGSPDSWMDKLLCASDKSWTVPVASYDANPYGLYDMLGNVWEWVADCAAPTHDGAPTDGSPVTAPGCDKRLTKGGAFHSVPWLVRAATRGGGLEPDSHPIASGFRVARALD